ARLEFFGVRRSPGEGLGARLGGRGAAGDGQRLGGGEVRRPARQRDADLRGHRHRTAPLVRRHPGGGRYCTGLTAVAPLRISKCSCGAAAAPVWPDLAITWPRRTVSPGFTVSDRACA